MSAWLWRSAAPSRPGHDEDGRRGQDVPERQRAGDRARVAGHAACSPAPPRWRRHGGGHGSTWNEPSILWWFTPQNSRQTTWYRPGPLNV